MKRKNIVDELIKKELSTLDDICEVLEKLKIVEKPDWKEFLTESDARMWYEANPTTAEKKRVLTALGYDFSELNKKQKLKYENIYPNSKTDFEITYRDATRLIAHLQNSLQQLAAAYKHCEQNSGDERNLPRFLNITVKLSGADGNAFAIIARCTKAMKQAGITTELQDQFKAEATTGDYNHLLTTCRKWFNVE